MVTFNYKEKKYTFKERRIFKDYKDDNYSRNNFVRWFSAWLTRYENEFEFLRVRLNGHLVARAATYTGV